MVTRPLLRCLVVWLVCVSLAFGKLLLPSLLSPYGVLALVVLVCPAAIVAAILVRLPHRPLARSVIRGAGLGVVAQFIPWLAAAVFALAASRFPGSWAEGLAYMSIYSFMLISKLWLVPAVGLLAGGASGGLMSMSRE